MGNVLVNTSNSRFIYPERILDPNEKPENYVYVGVTIKQYNEWVDKRNNYKSNKYKHIPNIKIA